MRFFAAHLEDEGDTWRELARLFRQKGDVAACVHCLKRALSKEGGNDLGVLLELSGIYRITKQYAKVRVVPPGQRLWANP
jgi:general transcription factor 3C polypeptide 3 (transcription factor C subunit 4)